MWRRGSAEGRRPGGTAFGHVRRPARVNAVEGGVGPEVTQVDVYEAVASRRAVRTFTDEPVPRAALERVLAAAGRSPSGGNLQPWHVHVLTGAPLAELKKRTVERAAAGDPGDERQYRMYPPEPKSPYRERQSAAAAQRFGALGVRRGDAKARRTAVAANWRFFSARCLLLCHKIPRRRSPASTGRRSRRPSRSSATRRATAIRP